MAAACATIPRRRCSGRPRIVASSSRALQMHPGQRLRHRGQGLNFTDERKPKKGGPLEITHQRASYAIVFIDRRGIPLKVGFLASAHWGAPVAAGREARRLVLIRSGSRNFAWIPITRAGLHCQPCDPAPLCSPQMHGRTRSSGQRRQEHRPRRTGRSDRASHRLPSRRLPR
jgi:hypothetical protein